MWFRLSALFSLCGFQKKWKIRNLPRVPVAWWSCEFEAIYGGRWLDSHKWIVKMAADKEEGGVGGWGSREARLELPEPQLLVQDARPPVRRRLWKIQDAVSCRWIDWPPLLTRCFCCWLFFPLAAPSTVSIMHQVSRTVDSITLSWSQPDQPNGIILDYELQYYEKVAVVLHCHGFTIKQQNLVWSSTGSI